MPSAANAKSEKPASSEATDNSPVRQIMTIIEHKIRNLEKRKSKLTSYRDLQKAGKELNSDQKVAVAKYDEVAQTLEFARDLQKQVTSVATSAEREAKKQAKREAWVRYAADTSKIREVLLILDCLVQMGTSEARDDFLNGTNGACKLTEQDLKILDDLYPEVTPKHEVTEEGQPGFHMHTTKAAEHLYAIIDGKPKEVLGTTYTHIKEIVSAVHQCGYFDKGGDAPALEPETEEEPLEEPAPEGEPGLVYAPPPAPAPAGLPAPAPAGLPAPGYPLRAMPPITLQEVEHAYFAQQYPQQRPIAEVIGSQNFFFLQESELDSPVAQPSPPPPQPGPIPTQTFTNQHFNPAALPLHPHPPHPALAPQPHFPPHPDFVGVPLPGHPAMPPPPLPQHVPAPAPADPQPLPAPASAPADAPLAPSPAERDDKRDDEWKESRSPEREDDAERKTQGQGDGQGRFRRYGRGGPRGTPNGYRGGRGAFQGRQGSDYHGGRHERDRDYQSRPKDGYQSRQYGDGYQGRHKDNYQSRRDNDGYYGNGDAEGQQGENGRERYGNDNSYGGFKSRGRGGPRGARRPPAPRAPHAPHAPHNHQQYRPKPDNNE
ncbi:hypothetical protein O0L34_g8858 [Tuta absoluta]|nr:hypothetical protein O0L34_g8858 [Tuta absoluta]